MVVPLGKSFQKYEQSSSLRWITMLSSILFAPEFGKDVETDCSDELNAKRRYSVEWTWLVSPPRKCRVSSPLFKRMFQTFADYWGCHLICKIIPKLEERCPNYNLKTHPASPKMFKSSLNHPKDAAQIIFLQHQSETGSKIPLCYH